uniref:CASP-like protein n=1 Tax=Leersia perrieri TaxID=77586 RepID=A0A0D9V0Y1_9ORYZ
MEPSSRGKPGLNGGFDYGSRRSYYAGSAHGAAASSRSSAPVDPCCVALRVFVLLATLVSAVVMAADRQSTTLQLPVAGGELRRVPVTAKWTYSSAFVSGTI